ncbi:signal peptidase I [Actinocrinis puniceicyclus]|uniref:Signal peptidase I n=1 Tax=Actinocrinis puniceicyclus TaxID=977794 RepID=A0A8J7WNT5_9ACTN|nr:signal peptidase I [Actinocrinis puniceicyclus]MBS2962824.1 signal peptidase I [Actinocrinis puniceicyclus]
MTGGRGAEGNGSGGSGGEAGYPAQDGYAAEAPDRDLSAAEQQPTPGAGAHPEAEGAAAGAGEPDQARPDSDQQSAAWKPSSALGWVFLPFVVVWRFLFPKKPRPFIVELPFLVVFALFLAFLIKTFLVQAFFIPSGSMQNTLAIGDRVLVNRASVWLGGQPQRGQVVVFQDPGGWLLPDETSTSGNWLTKTLTFVGVLPQDNGDLIKRVIGVGGDHVVCCNAQGQITVNGAPLDETYLFPGDQAQSGPDGTFDITVPQGRLWVMGDHRGVSEDSRAHQGLNGGTIPVSAVVGRADVIIWPISHWGTLPVPNTFKQTGLSALSAPGGIPAAATVGALPVALLRRRRKLRKLARKVDPAHQ